MTAEPAVSAQALRPGEFYLAFGVGLRLIEQTDLELLRSWRNRPDIAGQMLDQREITEIQQKAWFEQVRNNPAQQHFMLTYRESPVGSCNLKQPGGQAVAGAAMLESGFYLADPRFRGSMLAFFPALALNHYCFMRLGCQTLVAHVKPQNTAALRFNLQLGYQQQSEVTLQSSSGPQQLVQMTLDADSAKAAFHRFARYNPPHPAG